MFQMATDRAHVCIISPCGSVCARGAVARFSSPRSIPNILLLVSRYRCTKWRPQLSTMPCIWRWSMTPWRSDTWLGIPSSWICTFFRRILFLGQPLPLFLHPFLCSKWLLTVPVFVSCVHQDLCLCSSYCPLFLSTIRRCRWCPTL